MRSKAGSGALPIRHRWSRRWLLGQLCLVPFVAGCGAGAAGRPAATPGLQPAAFPVTLTDDTGRQVTVPKAPLRIVSAAPSNTEILFAIGLGDRVAGVTTACDFPAAARDKPKIGGLRPSLEAITALSPDLFVGIRGTAPEVVAALEAQRVPVIILNPADFPGVVGNIRTMGRLTGSSAAAERVAAEMEARWSAVGVRARAATRRPRVLYEIDATDPAAISAAGPGTFIDAMINAAGGENVLAVLTPGQQYPRVSAEVVLQADPDLIVLGDAPFGQSREKVAQRPGWGVLTAVQRGAVVEIADSDVTSRPGPRLVEGLDLVAQAIHPEIFKGPPAPNASGTVAPRP